MQNKILTSKRSTALSNGHTIFFRLSIPCDFRSEISSRYFKRQQEQLLLLMLLFSRAGRKNRHATLASAIVRRLLEINSAKRVAMYD